MRHLLLLLILLTNSAGFAQTAQFKGYRNTELEIEARVHPVGVPFVLARHVPDAALLRLLGTWESAGTESVYINGLPNSVNMLLWYLGFSDFSEVLAGNCAARTYSMNDSFAAALARICQWPGADAKSEDAMLDYWIALMGYDAPEEEYEAWRDFFRASSYGTQPADKTVKAMSLAIFLNPYFLLQN